MHALHRPRRLRVNQVIRDLCAETIPDTKKLIMPYFVLEGTRKREPITAMPGIDRVSIDNLLKDIESDHALGINTILVFGIPDKKDPCGSEAYNPDGIVQKAVREIKKQYPGLIVITDICLCEYTDHGHCGVVKDTIILNDPTLELLVQTAISHANAGADIVAPSDMMDGRIGAIRNGLDTNNYQSLPIMSYAAKYSSAFYGPFREAAGSAPHFGDRKTYQMDIRNHKEAIKEVLFDIKEGADIVMVKPALSFLDIITRVKEHITIPLCAYNVSGEYTMVKTMVEQGYANEQKMVMEIITSIFRAGADMVISYHTREIVQNKWIF